ncbi:hypothetical protein EDB80DRAFT_736809 [Ilyonectria destructans]|nr:hypothetical protein EDB80DRAFT_736809 [Ilyonectria destructans]
MSRRACDACKVRKVKCDGDESAEPCSNCRMSKLPCQYVRQARKRGRKPLQSPHPTPQHNRRPTRSQGLSDPPLRTASSETPSPSLISSSTPGASPGPLSVQQSTPQTTGIQPQPGVNACLQASHRKLVSSLLVYAPRSSLDTIVSKCIDIAVHSVFPLGPLFHEQSLRSSMPLESPLLSGGPPMRVPSDPGYSACVAYPGHLAKLRSYATLTALCASVSFLLQAESLTNGVQIGQSFLRASLETLKLYQDVDVAYPDASSLVIRICHASALHTDGRTPAAWQTLNEALGLAEQMQLYNEHSFEGLEPLEARIRRLAFWQVYILDKYAALVEGKPMRMHQFSIATPITTQLRAEAEPPLLVTSLTNESPSLEEQLLAGFYLIQRLWSTASEVALDLQVLSRFCSQAPDAQVAEEAGRLNLVETYLRFVSVLDDFPPSLECLDPTGTAENNLAASPRRRFWLQKAHLLVSYHCLRMVFLQRFADLGLANMLGYGNDTMMLTSRKMEIAHDFITVITSVPFDCLLANGESCVAKIRRIGTTLLEVMHEVDVPQLASRAKSLFPRLLDVLGKLDSRASDRLISESFH